MCIRKKLEAYGEGGSCGHAMSKIKRESEREKEREKLNTIYMYCISIYIAQRVVLINPTKKKV